MRLRLTSAVSNVKETLTFDEIWPQLCVSHYRGEETSAYIIERSLMRPRNVIKIFAHSKGFAANLAHSRIEEEDLQKGVKAYSQDLLVELDHELTDVFPGAQDLLYHFVDSEPALKRQELVALIEAAGIDAADTARVIDFLLYYGIFGVRGENEHVYYIYNVAYDLKILQIRAARAGDGVHFVMNPAFRAALGIDDAA